MKAYIVKDTLDYNSVVVFAESASKAKATALYMEEVYDAYYTDLRAKRAPSLDKYYKPGKTSFYWSNDEDRIALVKDGNFVCFELDLKECSFCKACESCDLYQNYKKEVEAENGR